MKARETVNNYPSKLRESANFAYRTIKLVCKNIGPRAPGSENETKAQEFLADELRKTCDTVTIEEFPVHPAAFLSWVPIAALMLSLAALAINFGFGLLSLIFVVIAYASLIGEFILYKPLLDPFFKKKISRNVFGVRKPSGEAKQRIIFCGHCDSSNEWRFTHLGGHVLLKLVLVTSVIGFIYGLVVSILAIARGYAFSFTLFNPDDKVLRILGFVFLGMIPFFFIASFFENRKLTVIGANDNLTGTLASAAIARFMHDNDIRFENTEVGILLSGSEEAGLRGAKAFCAKHGEEFKKIDTVFCAVDTLKDLDSIAVYNKDMSGIVKHSPSACALLKKGGEIAGVELPYQTVSLGSSDAVAATQAGLHATTLAAMDPSPARYYHTRRDTEEILDIKSIETGIDIMIETAFLFDMAGLKENYD